MRKFAKLIFRGFILFIAVIFAVSFSKPPISEIDITYIPGTKDSIDDDSLIFPFDDYTNSPSLIKKQSPLFLNNPSAIKSSVKYDPRTGNFIFYDKIGDFNYRSPYHMPFEEFIQFNNKKNTHEYWMERSALETAKGEKGLIDKLVNQNLIVPIQGFDKVFGSNTINIQPKGNAELIFGLKINETDNPSLPKELRKSVNFDFDMNIKLGVNGQIGDKMKLGINFDTDATFEFENNVKIGYEGKEDEIIQKIEAGNVTMPIAGSLITGSHNLFGLKTELKFGNLLVTTVFSQQKGERKTIEVSGGATSTPFEITADEYDANRHYFLAHYFRDRYDDALSSLPIIQSNIKIRRIEVWVTNRSGNFENSRDIIAFTDLAETETHIYNDTIQESPEGLIIPANQTNELYDLLTGALVKIRNLSQAGSVLTQDLNYTSGIEYEKVQNARLLSPSEYTFHANLGYISLNSRLNSDEVLAVAFEYENTVDGEVYQVGEFSNEGPVAPQALFLKLLKPTTLSTELPTWDLMMKNVYTFNAYQVNSQDFRLDVMYRNDKTGSSINYLPAGEINGEILLNVLNLDNLNKNNDRGADGFFDFIDKVTINSSNGKIFFPVVEPFGSYLHDKITDGSSDPEINRIADQYVFQELYDQTQSQAQQLAEKNKFFLRGEYKSSGGSEINLGAMNVPEGSVTVTAGGRNLTENVDYTVDYNLGRVTILNQSLLESTTPISISLENNSMFDIGTKSLLGNRFDYRISDNFNIGATVMHLHQKPLTNKVNIGNEPISNTIWGTDINLNQEVPFLTKFVDKFVPFIKTKTPSYIDFSGEFAHLIPGHPKILGEEGYTHIDDFEGSKVTIDLKTPSNWKIASTPQGQEDLFPEAKLSNDLKYGFNRAKIAWYNVNRDFQNSSVTPDYITNDDLSDHYVREIPEQEIFPDRDPQNDVPQFLYVLNLAYYPTERGPYNFDTESTEFSAGINEDGLLNEPETRWAGITRAITTNDFEEANIEFIEFWVLDPFIKNKDHEGGSLYLNLGNISEDILRDSRQSFENGLPAEGGTENLDSTVWGYVPILPRITEAFSTENDNALANQDVGLDGLSNSGESRKFRDYLTAINSIVKPELRDEFINDPSNDDYLFYFDPRYDALQKGILERYKRYNNQEGNSTTDNIDGNTISATELRPDMEDINRDYTLTENESYFQYKINISPGTMSVENNKYITGIRESYVTLRNEDEDTVKWYHFKIPLEDYEKAVGPIQDFKSIRFMRLFMKDWKEEVVLRFAEMDLVRGDWRKYRLSLLEGTEGIGGNEITDASLEINIVNIEENSSREPVNYVLPPGVTREISPNNPYLRQLNEQALSLKVINLSDGDARAAYKNASIDLRQFKRIQMFIHAEAIEGEDILNDDDLVAFVRLGSDFQENYYEYEIPLKLTPGDKFYNNGNKDEPDRLIVWPKENMLDLEFEELQRVKQSRNDKILKNEGNIKLTSRYSEDIDETGRRISIIGSPNLSNVRTIMIGIKNRKKQNNNLPDDGLPKSVEVWVNELRLAGFDEKGGWATRGRMQVNLADFSTLAIAGEYSTPGFGSIEKSVSERQQSTDYSYDFSSSTEVGRFFPQKYGVRIPVYFGYSEVFSNPEYDPLNPDIKMTTVLKNMSQKERNDYLKLTQDYLRRKSFNVTNIRISGNSEKKKSKEGGGDRRKNIGGGKPLWHISNWSVSYGFNESYLSNINTEFDVLRIHTGAIAYNYNVSPKNVKPFSKVKLFRRKMFKLLRDFNFYYAPSMLAFRTDLRKSYNEIQLRNINDSTYTLPASYDKQFTWNRSYDIHYNLTRGLKFTYTINNQSWVDEPDGKIDKNIPEYDQYRDSVLNNLKSLGRTTDYHQGFTAVWDVPIDKLPLLGWTNVNARYSGDYFWTYVPEAYDEEDNPIPLGNTLRNKQNIQITSQFNLERVYTKVKYLKQIDNQFKGKKKPDKKKFKDVSFTKENVKLKKGKAKSVTHNLDLEDVKVEVVDKSGQKIEGEIDISSSNRIRFTADKDYDDVKFTISGKKEEKENVLKIISDYTLYSLMSVRNLSLSYTSNAGTLVPGYLKDPSLFSFDDFTGEPGWEFILGMQQKQLEAIQFFQDGKKREWLSADTFLNEPVVFTSDIRWDFKATLKPFSGLRIDVSANRNESSTEQQLWAGNTDSDEDGRHEPNSIFTTGNFSMSILTIKTAFPGIIKSERDAFDQFLYNIFEIANSLADERSEENPNYNRNLLNKPRAVDDTVNTYPFGYSPTSKEVMLQAFLAAYTGFDNKYGRNPFPQIPLPNWRIKYDGLTYFELVRKAFKKVIINHNYTSNYRVANYTEDEEFIDLLYDQGSYFSGHIDEEGYFLPKYQIEGVSIDEKFIPLIGVDLDWNNDMSTRFEYKKTRTMTLSFTDDKLLETSRIEYMFGFGYKIPDLEVPINQRLFTSDLNFRFDFSYIDMITNIRRISADDIQPAAGNKSFTIKVKADYNLDKIMLSVFYDRIMNQPRVSTSFRTVNTHIGFSLRFNLANI